MKKFTQPKEQRDSGFALIVTVILLSLLAVMAVAFLSSSRVERGTASAVANKAKADLAAQTAVNSAIAQLVDNVTNYPDSVTGWESVNNAAGQLQYAGTVFYYHPKTPETLNNPPPAAPTPIPALFVLPLISGAVPQATPIPAGTSTANKDARLAALRSALPLLDASNSFDLNHVRFSNDSNGAIGSPPRVNPGGGPTPTPTPPPYRAQWLEVKNSDDKLTARYAFWMEDESFKANANLMGNTARGSTTLGDSPKQLAWQGVLPIAFPQTSPPAGYYDPMAQDIFDFRSKFRNSLFFDYRGVNQVKPNVSTADFSGLAEAAKFEATIFSGALDLSRSGSKRVNLNKVVVDENPDPTNPSAPTVAQAQTAVRSQLDQIIKTITYHLPNFGQRFYRVGTDLNSPDVPEPSPSPGPSPYRTIYLNKTAANIRDFVDTDSQPTIVNNDSGYTIRIGSAPTRAFLAKGGIVPPGESEVIAIGKESVPSLQEYMLRVKQIIFAPRIGAVPANYQIEIDHYLEFWNMTNQDIPVANLGPNPFLRIANQFGWDAGTGTNIPAGASRDFSMPLSSFRDANNNPLIFRAGMATVLTTDPQALPSTFPNIDPSRVFRPPAGSPPNTFRVYSGITTKKSGSQYRLDSIPRPVNASTASDFQTELILGNDRGTLEAFGGAAVKYMTVNVDLNSPPDNKFDTTLWYFRASSLKGNAAAPPNTQITSQTGDPRTNNEQLWFDSSSGVNDDQTGYKLELSTSAVPGSTTFTLLNSVFVDPSLWTDRANNTADAAHAPAVIGNAQLTTIGQLGQIFDPVRSKGSLPNGSGDIRYSRGGGRTFKIGQPERYDSASNPNGLWDGDSNSASREWTAWRLTDIFSTTDTIQLDGRVNVNGVTRDAGAAFKAAVYGYNFQTAPDSDPQIASQVFDNKSLDSFIAQLTARLANEPGTYSQFGTTVGPLFERGEVSEMPIFNTISSTGPNGSANYYLAPGIDTKTVYDRGREELFRRVSELITTRGNIFTVYAVGQSLLPPPPGKTDPIVTSTSQIKVTFRIDPVWNSGNPTDPFDPASTARFSKPDKYAVKILYAGE